MNQPPQVLIDETQPEPHDQLTEQILVPMLTLSVLDFVPVCRKAGNSFNSPDPKNLHFEVSLTPLLEITLGRLYIFRKLIQHPKGL